MNQQIDIALSEELAQRIKSKAQSSFNNAYQAALLTEGCTYIQGFLVWSGTPYKPIEHGWIELNEQIVDPTFPHFQKTAADLYYFPAQRLSVKKLKATIEEAKEDYPDDDPLPIYGSQPYDYYGDVMLGGIEYTTAYNEAAEKCRELNQPKKAN